NWRRPRPPMCACAWPDSTRRWRWSIACCAKSRRCGRAARPAAAACAWPSASACPAAPAWFRGSWSPPPMNSPEEAAMQDIALHDNEHARPGDKGNRISISLSAYREQDYALLAEQVTCERVAAHFAHRDPSSVQRYLLPNLGAMTFVLDDVLDGGVNDSLN